MYPFRAMKLSAAETAADSSEVSVDEGVVAQPTVRPARTAATAVRFMCRLTGPGTDAQMAPSRKRNHGQRLLGISIVNHRYL